MTLHLGNVDANSTLYIPFHTFDSNGASVTISGLAVTDIEIYKNGSTTQRSSDAGYALLDTDGIDFDGITGIHGFSIDLSDNTDAGFYAAGSFYWVVISAVTVDTRTVNFVAATFQIGPVSANVTQLGGVTQSLTDLKDFADDGYDPSTNKVQGVVLTDTVTTYTGNTPQTGDAYPLVSTEIAEILADTNELQTDWVNGGRLDLLIDAIKAKTDNLPADPADDSDIDTQLAAIAGYLDTEVAAILAAVDTEVAAIKAKTDSLTFTVAGQVDANVQSINDAALTGDGSTTPWGPA